MAKRWSFAHLVGMGARRAEETPTEDDKDKEAESAEDEKEVDGDEEAKSEGGDDADDEGGGDDSDKEASRQAIAAACADERQRCAAIFASPEAQGRIAMACELAFNTELSAEAAIGIMKATPAQRSGRLASAMATLGNPSVGSDAAAGAGGTQSEDDKLAASIIDAGKQVRRRR